MPCSALLCSPTLYFLCTEGEGRSLYSFMNREGAKQTSGKQIIIKILSEQCHFSQILATTVWWGEIWDYIKWKYFICCSFFIRFYSQKDSLINVNDKINVRKMSLEKLHNIYFYVLYEKICKEEITWHPISVNDKMMITRLDILNMVNLDNDNLLFLTKLFGPEFTKISKQRDKSTPNFRATQAINVKV